MLHGNITPPRAIASKDNVFNVCQNNKIAIKINTPKYKRPSKPTAYSKRPQSGHRSGFDQNTDVLVRLEDPDDGMIYEEPAKILRVWEPPSPAEDLYFTIAWYYTETTLRMAFVECAPFWPEEVDLVLSNHIQIVRSETISRVMGHGANSFQNIFLEVKRSSATLIFRPYSINYFQIAQANDQEEVEFV